MSLFSGECAEKDISFVGAIYEDFPDPGGQVPHLESGLWNIASGLWNVASGKLTQVGLILSDFPLDDHQWRSSSKEMFLTKEKMPLSL